MSVQACRVKAIGHILPYNFIPSNFNGNQNSYDDFCEESGLLTGYYDLRDMPEKDINGKEISPLKIFSDGMNGEFTFVGVIIEASYLENTHGELPWLKKFRNDSYVKDFSDFRIKSVFAIQEPAKELEFEIWQ